MGQTLSASRGRENLASPEKETIRRFFDGIASRYDQINSLLSLRLDENWRKRACRLILKGREEAQSLLDLGVGTGKFLSRFLENRSWKLAAGVDFAGEMLGRAGRNLPSSCRLFQADIHDLPFQDETFDLVVSSFTLRSVKNLPHFFGEVRRVLKPRGRVALLCLTRPTHPLARAVYEPYLRFYLPFVGGLLSPEPEAYRFLSQSIQSFLSPQEIAAQLEAAGLRETSVIPFTFGASTLIRAQK